jgi:hypothetical protein
MVNKMITAEEAKKLSGLSIEDHLDFIEQKIRYAAENKQHEVFIREEPYCLWLYPSRIGKLESDVIEVLRQNGFTVKLYYMESQFVDVALWIKW